MDLNITKILDDVRNKGYSTVESFFDKDTVKIILNDTTKNKFKINENASTGVFYETQYYFMHLLAESQKCYDFITSKFVINLCDQYLGNKYRLHASRYYETMSGHNMKWHVDNKRGIKLIDMKGLIFIVYLCDVDEGEFQYIEGSHKFNNDTPDIKSEFINNKYKHLIRSLKMPSGSIVIYDARGIHRANPFDNKNYVRKSLYFQVDAIENSAEKILVNTKFLRNINPDIEKILGFGKENEDSSYPKTNLNRYPINFKVLMFILKWFIYRISRFILRTEPRNIIKIFKK
tara:strand:- start:1873 stop:2739 length:867 start_codon:yes stop_codon:yes gene_type:complete